MNTTIVPRTRERTLPGDRADLYRTRRRLFVKRSSILVVELLQFLLDGADELDGGVRVADGRPGGERGRVHVERRVAQRRARLAGHVRVEQAQLICCRDIVQVAFAMDRRCDRIGRGPGALWQWLVSLG